MVRRLCHNLLIAWHLRPACNQAGTPPDARHVEILEEYIPNVVNETGMYAGLTTAEQEILTKEWMIQHQR